MCIRNVDLNAKAYMIISIYLHGGVKGEEPWSTLVDRKANMNGNITIETIYMYTPLTFPTCNSMCLGRRSHKLKLANGEENINKKA